MNTSVKVWDPLVRIFHWSLVVAFVVAYLTGEEETDLHIDAGYVVMGLIIFRLIWGFVGTQHARFWDFIYGPGEIGAYIRSLRTAQPRHYVGHNPLGGLMVVALLLALAVITWSGLELYAAEEGKGPLAANTQVTQNSPFIKVNGDEDEHEQGNEAKEEFWEEIHELTTNLTLFLIALHIAGVLTGSWLHRENLIRAMITGRKNIKDEDST